MLFAMRCGERQRLWAAVFFVAKKAGFVAVRLPLRLKRAQVAAGLQIEKVMLSQRFIHRNRNGIG